MRRRKPGEVLMLTRTLCPLCGTSWSGAELRADAGACPDCKRKADPDKGGAKFAPARHGPLVPGEPESKSEDKSEGKS